MIFSAVFSDRTNIFLKIRLVDAFHFGIMILRKINFDMILYSVIKSMKTFVTCNDQRVAAPMKYYLLWYFYILFPQGQVWPWTMHLCNITRMIKFIKTKLKKSDDQTSVDKYRLTANIIEYHNKSKLFFLRIIIPKFMKKRQLFHVKHVCKNVKINMFKWT